MEAHSNLSSETKRIAGDNKRMAKELRFQMQVLFMDDGYLWQTSHLPVITLSRHLELPTGTYR